MMPGLAPVRLPPWARKRGRIRSALVTCGILRITVMLFLLFCAVSRVASFGASAPAGRAAPQSAVVEEQEAAALGSHLRQVCSGNASAIVRVSVLCMATGPYLSFVPTLLQSLQRHYFTREPESCVRVTVWIWTDAVREERCVTRGAGHTERSRAPLRVCFLPHEPATFPAASLFRFHAYLQQEERLLREADYLHHVDVDVEFAAPVGAELLVPEGLWAVAHADNFHYDGTEIAGAEETDGGRLLRHSFRRWGPGLYFSQRCMFESGRPCVTAAPTDRQRGTEAYIDPERVVRYHYGGAIGGRAAPLLHLFRTVRAWIDRDLYERAASAAAEWRGRVGGQLATAPVALMVAGGGGRGNGHRLHGHVPPFHDESYTNRFWAEHPPARVFTAAYMYPVLEMVHPWLHRAFPVYSVSAAERAAALAGAALPLSARHTLPLLPPAECGRRYEPTLPVRPESGWVWPCVALRVPEDRLWQPRLWNALKCGRGPCAARQPSSAATEEARGDRGGPLGEL